MLTANESSYTEQLLTLLNQLNDDVLEQSRTTLDLEEIFLNCYANSRAKCSGLAQDLACITKCGEEILGWAQTAIMRLDDELYDGGEFPDWYLKSGNAILEKVTRFATKHPDAAPLVTFMASSVGKETNLIEKCIAYFKTAESRLSNVNQEWQEAQEKMRKLLKPKHQQRKDMRTTLMEIIKEWATVSEERAQFMRLKGINIPQSTPPQVPIAQPAPKTVHQRRQKTNCTDEPVQVAGPADEKPWKISLLNYTGTEITSFDVLLSENSDELRRAMNENCGWTPDAFTTMRKLRNLVAIPPHNRQGVGFRINGLGWYKIKVCRKYRMLAHIDDVAHKILLMAGHRSGLYAALGYSKNES